MQKYVACRSFVMGARNVRKNQEFDLRWAESEAHFKSLVADQLIRPLGKSEEIPPPPPATKVMGEKFREALAKTVAKSPEAHATKQADGENPTVLEAGEAPLRRGPGRPSKHEAKK